MWNWLFGNTDKLEEEIKRLEIEIGKLKKEISATNSFVRSEIKRLDTSDGILKETIVDVDDRLKKLRIEFEQHVKEGKHE